jgi:hypothetical protein
MTSIDKALLFMLTVAAIWRLIVLIVADRGPFDIIAKARHRIAPDHNSWFGDGIRCSACLSFWFGLMVATVYWYMGLVGSEEAVLWWWGLSGAVFFVDMRAMR